MTTTSKAANQASIEKQYDDQDQWEHLATIKIACQHSQ